MPCPSPLSSRENQFDNPRGKSSSRQEGSDNEEGRTAPTGETKSVDGPTLSTRGWKKRRLPYIALSYVTRTGPNLTKTFLIWLCFQHSYTFLIGLRILYYGLTGCNLIWIFEFLIGILFGLGLNPFVIVSRLWWAYKPDNSWINVWSTKNSKLCFSIFGWFWHAKKNLVNKHKQVGLGQTSSP